MSIADKLTTIAENVQKVYDAGRAAGGGVETDGSVYYAKDFAGVFKGASFSDGYSLVIKTKATPSGMYQTFQNATGIKNFKFITEDKNGAYTIGSAFHGCSSIEVIDFTECSRTFTSLNTAFYGCGNLKSIFGALDLTSCTAATNAFVAYALEDVEFVPNTIFVSTRFVSDKLTDKSIDSIIDGLADLTGSVAQTITLNGVGSKLTDEQKATISAKNWTLAY